MRLSVKIGGLQNCYAAEDDLKFLIFLLLPPKCSDYRYSQPWLDYVILEIKSRTSAC